MRNSEDLEYEVIVPIDWLQPMTFLICDLNRWQLWLEYAQLNYTYCFVMAQLCVQ